eukprot:TRINITY_DN10134_c0_g1_i3.p1 TRINITY_DN10134_c0_g1~~TRINITY_DN10134_c0_g1_i3.p1  ORF type:complete len:238 (+),score=29.65 TRINITY_DN10134_c0_g1_i3:874-1587(+)
MQSMSSAGCVLQGYSQAFQHGRASYMLQMQQMMSRGQTSCTAMRCCQEQLSHTGHGAALRSKMRPAIFSLKLRGLCVMKAYIEVQRLDDAEHVISRMRAAGVQPSFPTWKSIIHAADAADDVKRADQLYGDALLPGTIKPYRPWRSITIKDASGNIQPQAEGTVMDLHRLNSGTGRAAIRHELHKRQKDDRRHQLPLYIITGQGGGQLVAAVSETLKSHGIHFVLLPGVVVAPSPNT